MQVIDATNFGEEDINMEQITITAHSPLNGLLLNGVILRIITICFLLIGLHDKELKKEVYLYYKEGHNHKLDYGDLF